MPLATKLSWLVIIIGCAISATAEIWSNSKPLLMKYQAHYYVPIWQRLEPERFDIHDRVTVNYKLLEFSQGDWAIWPINRWDPYESNKTVALFPAPPSHDNWLGTDDRGRDILARLLYGFRFSMSYAFVVWFFSAILATIYGCVSGFAGGWVDLLGQRLVEILGTIPSLFILIFLLSIFDPGFWILAVISSALGWMGLSYFVRGEVLRCRHQLFVEAARACGASPMRILFRHVLPNSLSPLLTFMPYMLIANITGLAALDFLGFGLPPPTPSWGELLQQAQGYLMSAWWLAVFPATALLAVLLSMSLIGESLRQTPQS